MKTYQIFASETVFYMKTVLAESEEQAKKMIFDGEIDFDYGDITDGDNFQVNEIEEEKRYG